MTPPRQGPMRILLIEDEDQAANLVAASLPQAAITRVTSLKAVVPAALADADVVLLDLGLPDSQGLSTLTRIRDLDPTSTIVVLTAMGDRAVAETVLEAGAQEWVDKDDDLHNLEWALVRAIARQSHLLATVAALTGDAQDTAAADPFGRRSKRAAQSLAESRPLAQAEFRTRYRTLVDDALEERTFKTKKPTRAGRARRLARDMAVLRASPQDVVDLHLTLLRSVDDENDRHALALQRESRMLLLEVMGHLALAYRDPPTDPDNSQ